jgi:hypothetical protein
MSSIIEILIDHSASMGKFTHPKFTTVFSDGSSRFDLVKKILLRAVIPSLNSYDNIVIRTHNSTDLRNRPIYYGSYNANKLKEAVEAILDPPERAVASTAEAVRKAIDNISSGSFETKALILFTDPDEPKREGLLALLAEAKNHANTCAINIVGIAQDEEAKRLSAKVCELSKGEYLLISGPENEDKSNKEVQAYMKSVIQKSFIAIDDTEQIKKDVGRAGEKYLFEHLKSKYSDKVVWLNEEKELGGNHDFEIRNDNVVEFYIECKASHSNDQVFFVTRNEWLLFLSNPNKYKLFFIKNVLTNPQLMEIENLEQSIMRGNIVPFTSKPVELPGDRIPFTILGANG